MCLQAVRVVEPTVPFTRETKVTEGRLYTIIGMFPPHAHRFSVNFCIGGESGEKALHLDTRLDKKTVVRNSFFDNAWGKEEKQGGHFPLVHSQPFELMILIDEFRFFIAYNGTQYAEFVHRRSPRHIDTINIMGDVTLSSYNECEAGHGLSEASPQSLGRQIKEAVDKHERGRHVYDLPGGVSDKTVLRIVGIPEGSFFLNFTNTIDSEENVGLHLNFRHRLGKVVLNSRCKGKWGEEQRPSQILFHVGVHFDLAVSVSKNELRLQLGDNPAAFFPLRNVSASDLKHLLVDGEVHLVWLSQEDIGGNK